MKWKENKLLSAPFLVMRYCLSVGRNDLRFSRSPPSLQWREQGEMGEISWIIVCVDNLGWIHSIPGPCGAGLDEIISSDYIFFRCKNLR